MVDEVKFRDPETGLSCYLNVNERLGYINSQLIRRYCIIHPQLPEVIRILKRWAKLRGLNNPSGDNGPTTFSSYALILMTIALFQVCAFV